jgi:hypothetical protein
MKLARMLSLLSGALLACQSLVVFAETTANSTASVSTTLSNTHHITPPDNGLWIHESSQGQSEGNSDSKTITLTLPPGAQIGSLKAVLNGMDISATFSAIECIDSEGVCATATLSRADGLRPGKNVLYATTTNSNGTLASSRLRFNVGGRVQTSQSSYTGSSHLAAAQIVGNGIADTNFTPPTVTFNTLTAGGWQGNTPWLQIGNETLPDSSVSACPSSDIYLVIVLDRFTLLPVPGATQCEANAANLSAYLKTLTSDQAVIIGTLYYHNADANLNTTAIGGTEYTMSQTGSTYPRGYLAIGAGGAAPGSAYENRWTDGGGQVNPFATGMMVEDPYGNYNFQSSLAVEYRVTPNDSGNNNQSTVTLYNVGTLSQYNAFSYPDKVVFFSPANQTNGFWLLTLQRDNLNFSQQCGAAADSQNQRTIVPACGTFYPTGVGNASAQLTAYSQLASALNNLTPNQLAFLVSVGTPVVGKSQWDVAQIPGAYYKNFGDALENLGGVAISTLSLYAPGSAYSYVTCTGCGGPLNGFAALSTTAYAQQGQTGAIHGVLGRYLNGLYCPMRASQETPGSTAVSDFTLDTISSQQPVEWPELSGKPLPGASSVSGQVSAYNYASYQLITQYYVKGAQGDYLDDIHYYFTGSLNTLLDYHTFDPFNLQFPGQSGSCYIWTDPVTNTALPCFTQQDLQAVASQLSTEIVDLDNVLVFMVNGSTNMKDVVATGNGSAALALVGAAAEIEGSHLQPQSASPVTTNVSNILNLVSSVVNIGVTVATDGLVPPELVDNVTRGGSIIGSLFGAASSITGGLSQGGGPAALPSPQYAFTTTIGDLANSSLQQQVAIGFDSNLDSITSDWGKLSSLGPLITNSNYPEFYSPNQVAQNVAVQLMGQGSQRDFYLALLPAFYSIHYYPSWVTDNNVTPANPPNMGNYISSSGYCNSWYDWNSGGTPPNVSVYHATYAGVPDPWSTFSSHNPTPIDYYVIAGEAQNKSQSNQFIPFIDQQVSNTLFGSGGLNIPMDAFVTRTGPMAAKFLDTTNNGFDGFPANQTYSCGDEREGIGTPPQSPYVTVTTLTVPSSAVLGEDVSLQVKVTSQAGVPKGTVSVQDGATVLGSATLDTTGAANFSVSGLALGAHSLVAYYLVNDPYYASQSAASTLNVYANSPQLTLALSTRNLSIPYGSSSSPIAMQMVSKSGLAGPITLSCTGLPAGMTCNFNPAQPTITSGGTASSSLTISAEAAQAAMLPLSGGITGLLLLPLSVVLLWRVRKNSRALQASLCILLLALVSFGSMVGCGAGSNKPSTSGTQTVLVNATSGSFTISVPLIVNVQ